MVLQGNFLVVGGKATEAANLFLRSGSSWSSLSTLVAPNPIATDLVGSAVGVSGETVIVGALQEASKATGLNGDGADNSFVGDAGPTGMAARPGVPTCRRGWAGPVDSAKWGVATAGSGQRVLRRHRQ